MSVRLQDPGALFRVQRDGPSPADQAHEALVQELSRQMARASAELQVLTGERGRLTDAQRERVHELQGELAATASQLRQLERDQRQMAIDEAAQAMAARALGQRASTAAPTRSVQIEPRIPDGAVEISIAFFICTAAAIVLFPLMRSLGRILERRAVPPQRLDSEAAAQLQRMEQAIETVAIEVERIAEGQRFTTRLLAEREKVPQHS